LLRKWRASHAEQWASPAETGPAIGVDRLAVDLARGRTAQESDRGRDVFRLAAPAGNGPVDQVGRWFRRVPRTWPVNVTRRSDRSSKARWVLDESWSRFSLLFANDLRANAFAFVARENRYTLFRTML
jgi:hypothetical protein